MSIRDRVHSSTCDEGWAIHTEGSLQYRGRVAVPQLTYLREEILREFHYSWFAVHPGGMKMYHDLRRQDEKTRWGFHSMVSHVLAGKG